MYEYTFERYKSEELVRREEAQRLYSRKKNKRSDKKRKQNKR